MNEFAQKKIGELLAFSRFGMETIALEKDALETIFPAMDVRIFGAAYEMARDELVEYVGAQDITQLAEAKAEKTFAKLITLRDHYIAGQWTNATEILEWESFFQGAAIAHWNLILGISLSTDDYKLGKLAKKSISFHEDFLQKISASLRQTGVEKSL